MTSVGYVDTSEKTAGADSRRQHLGLGGTHPLPLAWIPIGDVDGFCALAKSVVPLVEQEIITRDEARLLMLGRVPESMRFEASDADPG